MRKVYTVNRILPGGGVVVQDALGQKKTIYTDRPLVPGDSVVAVNDVVVSKAERTEQQVFNV